MFKLVKLFLIDQILHRNGLTPSLRTEIPTVQHLAVDLFACVPCNCLHSIKSIEIKCELHSTHTKNCKAKEQQQQQQQQPLKECTQIVKIQSHYDFFGNKTHKKCAYPLWNVATNDKHVEIQSVPSLLFALTFDRFFFHSSFTSWTAKDNICFTKHKLIHHAIHFEQAKNDQITTEAAKMIVFNGDVRFESKPSHTYEIEQQQQQQET